MYLAKFNCEIGNGGICKRLQKAVYAFKCVLYVRAVDVAKVYVL